MFTNSFPFVAKHNNLCFCPYLIGENVFMKPNAHVHPSWNTVGSHNGKSCHLLVSEIIIKCRGPIFSEHSEVGCNLMHHILKSSPCNTRCSLRGKKGSSWQVNKPNHVECKLDHNPVAVSPYQRLRFSTTPALLSLSLSLSALPVFLHFCTLP